MLSVPWHPMLNSGPLPLQFMYKDTGQNEYYTVQTTGNSKKKKKFFSMCFQLYIHFNFRMYLNLVVHHKACPLFGDFDQQTYQFYLELYY